MKNATLPLLAAIAVACAGLSCANAAPEQKVTLESILARIKAPTFPDRDFVITAHGARPGED